MVLKELQRGNNKVKNTGLILEGGGSRGVFTAGALDYLMERNIYLPYVVGVSMGACNAIDYAAKQIGRTKECSIIKEKAYQILSVKSAIKNHSLFDMDMVFDKFPNQYIPFDYETFFQSDVFCEIGVTNALTGKTEYFNEYKSRTRLMNLTRASSSLPVVSPMVTIDGVPYLDGGIADSIPLVRSIKHGNRKHVVILTRKMDYRKKIDYKNAAFVRAYYRKYPDLYKSIIRRPIVYNRTLDLMEELERKGKIFVIRPNDKVVARAEKNVEKLEAFYQHGYDMMKDQLDDLLEYLERN